jgi:hypothetical protein
MGGLKMKKIKFVLISICIITFLFTSNIYAISIEINDKNLTNNTQNIKSPPYPASNPIPANNSIDIELNITLSWSGGDPDGDPVSYNIFFGTNSNPPNVEVVYLPNTYNPGTLEYNTKYYWRIDTYSYNGEATTGPLWTFITKNNTPPIVPNTPSPSNNSINIPRNINLSWFGGDPDGDMVKYDIYFGTNIIPPNVVIEYNKLEYNPGLLNYNTNYYWRVDAIDDYGYITTGPLWKFTTKDDSPPNTPGDPIPDNQSINISVNITLIWSGGDPDNDPVTYNLYLGKDSNPPLEIENLNVTMYTPNRLDFISRYYWRVDAIDDYGYITTGPLWTFITRENAPPHIPNEPVPANNSTNIYIDAILSWKGGDPDNDPVTYDVYFGTESNPPKVESNLSILSYKPTDMNTTTMYYWRLEAWDNYNNSASSPIWNFKTSIYNNSPPNKPSRPNGPTTGKPGISYTYSSSTVDSNGEPIFYKFDWDDGIESGWLGPYNSGQTITTSHVWNSKGSYAVKVKAKDIYGGESFWSEPLSVNMPKNKVINRPILNFLQQYPNLFPILRQLLQKL